MLKEKGVKHRGTDLMTVLYLGCIYLKTAYASPAIMDAIVAIPPAIATVLSLCG